MVPHSYYTKNGERVKHKTIQRTFKIENMPWTQLIPNEPGVEYNHGVVLGQLQKDRPHHRSPNLKYEPSRITRNAGKRINKTVEMKAEYNIQEINSVPQQYKWFVEIKLYDERSELDTILMLKDEQVKFQFMREYMSHFFYSKFNFEIIYSQFLASERALRMFIPHSEIKQLMKVLSSELGNINTKHDRYLGNVYLDSKNKKLNLEIQFIDEEGVENIKTANIQLDCTNESFDVVTILFDLIMSGNNTDDSYELEDIATELSRITGDDVEIKYSDHKASITKFFNGMNSKLKRTLEESTDINVKKFTQLYSKVYLFETKKRIFSLNEAFQLKH